MFDAADGPRLVVLVATNDEQTHAIVLPLLTHALGFAKIPVQRHLFSAPISSSTSLTTSAQPIRVHVLAHGHAPLGGMFVECRRRR